MVVVDTGHYFGSTDVVVIACCSKVSWSAPCSVCSLCLVRGQFLKNHENQRLASRSDMSSLLPGTYARQYIPAAAKKPQLRHTGLVKPRLPPESLIPLPPTVSQRAILTL